jgi:hypothetical protein
MEQSFWLIFDYWASGYLLWAFLNTDMEQSLLLIFGNWAIGYLL